jgi:hypothetical protein
MLDEVTRDRSLRDLAESLVAGGRKTSDRADRVEHLVATGMLDEADVEVTEILLDVMTGKGAGSDRAAIRVTTALTLARVARGLRDDVELGLGALDGLTERVSREAAELGEARVQEVAAALDAAGEHDGGQRAREIAARFAKRAELLRRSTSSE